MPARLIILSLASPTALDVAFEKFARFLGIEVAYSPLPGDGADATGGQADQLAVNGALALGQSAWRLIYDKAWFRTAVERAGFVFIYGLDLSAGAGELGRMTDGAVTGITTLAAGSRTFEVQGNVEFGDFPVSGQSYAAEVPALSVFSSAAGAGVESYITVDGQPLFVSRRCGDARVFMLAGADLVDLDLVPAPRTSLRPWYAQLVAMAIFTRSAFGAACWTAPTTGATLVIDDPYLQKRYGFVRYEDLLAKAAELHCAVTIGFIPYYHSRFDAETVALLLRHRDKFSIAVHGCDHTDGEFASPDESWMEQTASCALDRMESLTKASGMPFDRVMVFPQGKFSEPAVNALQKCGYQAVVNSTPWPINGPAPSYTLRELLGVAVTRFGFLPIFVRRYPVDVFDFAFDALFQKPVLLVEHHGFFRNGYDSLARMVQSLSVLRTRLKWKPLGATIESACVVRKVGEHQLAIRHFTARFNYWNDTDLAVELLLEKPEDPMGVDAVLIGNDRVPFECRSGMLLYRARVGPKEELNVRIAYKHLLRLPRHTTLRFRLAASLRRRFSEIRDNHLSRSLRLLATAETFKHLLAGK